jgi:3'(2'), 5'-bisphosphate nucleotidase
MKFFFFLKVGLALVVNGKVEVGVMGCPNWTNGTTANKQEESFDHCNGHGILMVSHAGCGTWSRHLSPELGQFITAQDVWKRCFVDTCSVVHMARFCIPDSQTWNMIPLSLLFGSITDESDPKDENKILLQYACCGRFVTFCVYHYGCLFVSLTSANIMLVNQQKAFQVLADS